MKQAFTGAKPFQAFRDRYLAAVLMVAALLITTIASAQSSDSTRYSVINGYGFKYKRHIQDSVAAMPLSTSPHAPYRAGGYRYNVTDTCLELWTGAQWIKDNRATQLNDSMFVVGRDTITIRGTGGGGSGADSTIFATVYGVDTAKANLRADIAGKQPAGNYITALTGDITASGPGSASATIASNAVTNSKFRQSAGLSIVGNNTNATANVADITAGSDNQVLRRSGTGIGFGAVNLASSNAVTGILPIGNNDTSSTNHLVTQSDLNDTSSALRAAIGAGGAGQTLYSDLGPLSETKIFSPAKGAGSSDAVTNYSYQSVDSARYNFSTTHAGTGGNEFGGWLAPSTSGDSLKVTAPFWIVFGDSQAEGHPNLHGRLHPLVSGSAQNTFSYNYPDSSGQLSYHLRELTNMRWYNHGIGGQTTVDMRKRFYRDVLGVSSPNSADGRGDRTLNRMPQGVVIIGGINDIFNSVPQKTIQENLEWMASQCQQNGVRCVILNIPGDALASQDILQVIGSINTWLKSGVMDQYGACVVDYNSWWNDPAYGYDNVHHNSMIADDIHPTKVGYDSLANYIYRQARLPKITKVRFINQLDPAGFTGYSRPANITINSAPYTITSDDALINISTYVPDSVWIKIISSTNVTGTSYSGFSHIEWLSDNNPLDSPYYTKRTLFSGSQKANMNASSLMLQAPTNQDAYTVFDVKMPDGINHALQVQTSSTGSSVYVYNADSAGSPKNMAWIDTDGKLRKAAVPSSSGWGLTGNTLGATGTLGSTDNENWNFISNNTIRGSLSAGGIWRLGNNTDNGTMPVQLNGRTIITGSVANNLMVSDDAVNGNNASTVLNITSNSLPGVLITTPSSANTLLIRDYSSTTNLFTIGADNNVGFTHLLTDAATSGNKYSYSAQNTFSPTSGTANRWAFDDATTVNQTGGANGIYASFYAHPTLTAAADPRAFWNTVGNNMLNTSSGNTLIGTTSNNGYKLQVNGAVSTVTDSAGSPKNMAWIDTDGKLRKAAVPTATLGYQVYTALLSQSGTSDPTATILGANDIGTIVWTRNGTGNYTGTLSGAFTSNKTWLVVSKGDGVGSFVNGLLSRTSSNAVLLTITDNGGTSTDGFNNISIEIRVYP